MPVEFWQRYKSNSMGEKCIVPNAVGVIGHRGKKIEAWTKSHTLQKNELKVNYELKCKI